MMKKIASFLVAATVLTACSSGVVDNKSVPKEAKITHVCIEDSRTTLNYSANDVLQFMQNSLKKKGITSERFTKAANCPNVLKSTFKGGGRKVLAVRGVIRLLDLNDNRNLLGEITYYRRGEERAISHQTGFEGQIDRMIAELFKNY